MYHKIEVFNSFESIQKEEKMCVQQPLQRKGMIIMANKVNLRICLTIIVLLLVMTGLAKAATITVGSGAGYDFDSIQAGVDTAKDGDTVLVASGEYVITEPLTFRGKAITVRSEAGPEITTIRMSDSPGDLDRASVVIFEDGETETTVLEGFTISGGKGCWWEYPAVPGAFYQVGGGIFCTDSSPTINICVISDNQARDIGGGVFLAYSSAVMSRCTIRSNSTNYTGGGMEIAHGSPTLIDSIVSHNSILNNQNGQAGGLIIYGSSCKPVILRCTISANSAPFCGGGIQVSTDSQPTFIDCLISDNKSGAIAGILCSFSSITTLKNCIITRNSAERNNGGLGCGHDAEAILTNCTITENVAGGHSGGIMSYDNSSVTVRNCIVFGNTASSGPEIGLDYKGYHTPTIMNISYSDIGGGISAAHIEQGTTLHWEEGNIDADPRFAADNGYWADVNDTNIVVEPNDPNAVWIDGDYHLKSEAGRWDPVSESWVVNDVTSPCIDAGDPNSAVGDEHEPNGGRINMGAYGGTAEASMSPAGAEEIVYIQWLGHSSVKVWTDDCIVYVDPQSLSISPHDATLVCVTHTHGDHYSSSDIARVSNADTQFIGPPDVVSQYGRGLSISPDQTMEFDFVNVKAVPSYNTNKNNHPKSNNWVGYIIELGGKRIYVAGDTDLIDEMKSLGDIEVAFLPAGGTYTMNATEAAEATGYIKPDFAIPYHWGRNVGTLRDAQTFAELAQCAVKILTSGETISSDSWPVYSPLIAHWAIDEAEGNIVHDSAGENYGTLSGDPVWQPSGGKIAGALRFDGIDDYISTNFVQDPADGAFSVFAWIKGDVPGQVVISQTDGTGSGETWLGAEPVSGKLMTGLVPPAAGRFVPQPLVSESIITDDQWHHIGFAWDGSYRTLYMDGIEVAKDTSLQAPLKSADGGLYIGAGKNLQAGTFFSGLIDDIRIYNQALSTDEIAALTH